MDAQPCRCFSCGKVLTDHIWKTYTAAIDRGEESMDVCAKLKIRRRCCRRMLMTDVDHRDHYLKYPSFPDRIRLVGSRFAGDDVLDEEEDDEDGDAEVEPKVKPKTKSKAKVKKDEEEVKPKKAKPKAKAKTKKVEEDEEE